MQMHEIIQADPGYQKYADKYFNPMIAYFGKSIPTRYTKKFLEQATVEEVVTFHMGYYHAEPWSIPSILESVQNKYGLEIPEIEGILTGEFWEKWRTKHFVEVLDCGKIFGK